VVHAFRAPTRLVSRVDAGGRARARHSLIEHSTLIRRGIRVAQRVHGIARRFTIVRFRGSLPRGFFARRSLEDGARPGDIGLDGFPVVIGSGVAHSVLLVAAEGVPRGGARYEASRAGDHARTRGDDARSSEGRGEHDASRCEGICYNGKPHASSSSSRLPTRSTPVQRFDIGTSSALNTVSAQPSIPGFSG